MNIQGFQKTTLLDYPGKVAATIFFGGCNFCCPFCHNKDLVLAPHQDKPLSPKAILSFLEKRVGILDGVCVTGGEPTLQRDLAPFLSQIKDLGLSVKLDTNGYRPDDLISLCEKGLVDYVAMDIKSSPEGYASICGILQPDISLIQDSVSFLLKNTVPYEFRTTVVKPLHEKEHFTAIADWIAGAEAYFLQSYQESENVILPKFSSYTPREMEEFRQILLPSVPNTKLRGIK